MEKKIRPGNFFNFLLYLSKKLYRTDFCHGSYPLKKFKTYLCFSGQRKGRTHARGQTETIRLMRPNLMPQTY